MKRGGFASFVAPQTPPRKSVVSVVHVKPLCRADESKRASHAAVLKRTTKHKENREYPCSPGDTVGGCLVRPNSRETLGRPRVCDLTPGANLEPTGAYRGGVVLEALVRNICSPAGRIA